MSDSDRDCKGSASYKRWHITDMFDNDKRLLRRRERYAVKREIEMEMSLSWADFHADMEELNSYFDDFEDEPRYGMDARAYVEERRDDEIQDLIQDYYEDFEVMDVLNEWLGYDLDWLDTEPPVARGQNP
jgi:hypothetical protein